MEKMCKGLGTYESSGKDGHLKGGACEGEGISLLRSSSKGRRCPSASESPVSPQAYSSEWPEELGDLHFKQHTHPPGDSSTHCS